MTDEADGNVNAQNFFRIAAVFRGFIGTLSALALMSSLVDLRLSEFSRAAYAALIAWNDFADNIGILVADLPFIPTLSHYQVNAVMFTFSVSLPAVIGFSNLLSPTTKKHPNWWFTKAIFTSGFLLMSVICLLGPYAFFAGLMNPSELSDYAKDNLQWYDYLILGTGFLGIPLLGALWLSAFRVGALLLVCCLCSLQLFYFAPVVGEVIRDWTSSVLTDN